MRDLIEKAEALVAALDRHFGEYSKPLSVAPEIFKFRTALTAAKEELAAPSEDRVREAAGRCVRALLMDSRCTEGDRLAIKKRGSDGNEHDLGAWSHDAALNVIAEALRPYVTPAPALPAGTVAVNVETLREGVAVLNRAYLGGINRGDDDVAKSHNALSKILPPPPRPEPPKELVAEWERMATKYVRDLMLGGPDAAFLEHSPHVMRAYVAALRAAWEADPKGKQ